MMLYYDKYEDTISIGDEETDYNKKDLHNAIKEAFQKKFNLKFNEELFSIFNEISWWNVAEKCDNEFRKTDFYKKILKKHEHTLIEIYQENKKNKMNYPIATILNKSQNSIESIWDLNNIIEKINEIYWLKKIDIESLKKCKNVKEIIEFCKNHEKINNSLEIKKIIF